MERGVAQPFAAARGGREHCRARVDTDHGAFRPDFREELRRVKAWAAAPVQYPMTGLDGERFSNQSAAAKHVALAGLMARVLS